ncbi:MAG: hypothetical protein ABII18_10985 [bacterium]|nr:hypothetical protein [bacterium]MBU1918212.1 hypothetical protein [bacterium]
MSKKYLLKYRFQLVIILICGFAILTMAFSQQIKPYVHVKAYDRTEDTTDFPYRYTLKKVAARRAAEMLSQSVNNDNNFDFSIQKPVQLRYNDETNTLYFQSTRQDFETLVYQALKKYDEKS